MEGDFNGVDGLVRGLTFAGQGIRIVSAKGWRGVELFFIFLVNYWDVAVGEVLVQEVIHRFQLFLGETFGVAVDDVIDRPLGDLVKGYTFFLGLLLSKLGMKDILEDLCGKDGFVASHILTEPHTLPLGIGYLTRTLLA